MRNTPKNNTYLKQACHKLLGKNLRNAVIAYQQGIPIAAERLRQAFAPLIYKLGHRYCVYSILGEDAENTLWMLFYDFLSKYKDDDYTHLPGLIRRFLILRLLNTMTKEGKHWDIERCLENDEALTSSYGKEDLQDVLNKLALTQEIDLLPPEQAQVIKDVYYEGYPQKQVASSINCSTRNVRRYQTKALSALRSNLIS